jgi:hypothetical protein
MTDRIVQTTWTDAGRHQPLPPPEDTQGDEIERLTARVAELEAMRAKERDEWDGCAKDLDRMLSEKEANRVVLSIEKEKQSERIVGLEAKLDRCVALAMRGGYLLRTFNNDGFATEAEAVAAIRRALESPEPRP